MIIDLIIIAVLALSIFLGYKKGLIELSVKLCAVVIAIIVTLVLYRPISNFIIQNTELDESIQTTIVQKAEGTQEEQDSIQQLANQVGEQIKNTMLPGMAQELSHQIIQIGVMIILYLGIKIALRFVTKLANLVAKLPIIKQFNKLGGSIYGAIRGILMIYAVLLIIGFVGKVNPQNIWNQKVNDSFIGKNMYEHNVIEVFLK